MKTPQFYLHIEYPCTVDHGGTSSKVKNIKKQIVELSDRRSDRRYLGPLSHPQKSKRLYVLLKLQGKRDSESFILSKDGEMKLILH